MELRQVEYVLAVIEQGSFTAGADAAGVTQPSLSEGIRRLEAELGVRLFDRVGRTVLVTDAGRAFEGPARRMIRERAVVLDAVGAVRRARRAARSTWSRCRRSRSIRSRRWWAASARSHPGVVVRVAAPEDASALEGLVADGRSEVGAGRAAGAPRRSRRDHARRVRRSSRCARRVRGCRCPAACPSPGSRACRSSRRRPARRRATSSTAPLAAASVAPQVAVEISQREAIAPLVLSGAGTSFLPRAMAETLGGQGAVVARLVPAPDAHRSVSCIARIRSRRPRARSSSSRANTGRGAPAQESRSTAAARKSSND